MSTNDDRPSYGQDPQAGQGRPWQGQNEQYGQGGHGAQRLGPYGQGQGQGGYGAAPQGRPDYGPAGQGPYGQGPQGGYGGPQGGWDQSAGPRYGTQPYAAYAQPQEATEPPKYRQLLLATLVSLGIYLLSSVPGFLMLGDSGEFRRAIDEQMAAQGQSMTAEEAQTFEQIMDVAAKAGVAMLVLFTLVMVGLYLLVYVGLRRRRNWARVTGIVFAILSLVFTLPGLLLMPFMGGTGMISLVLSLLSVAVDVWWLVLAFNGRISRYLQQRALMG
ncbi:hypothetical protein ACL90Y_00260 [Micrococcus luteus]